ncbi:MAG: CBS domain-containing protein [Dehalococcoidales bacterium]|jgi:hypothetical protein
MSNGDDKHPFMSKHLILVLALLLALLVTECLIFWLIGTNDQKDLLALTFGTFGTWIGAGAAYFFGRENMKTATESMLKINRSTKDILSNVSIKELNPRGINKLTLSDTISKALEWVNQKVQEYILVIIDDNGKFCAAVSDEAIYQYILKKKDLISDKSITVADFYKGIEEDTMKDLIDFYESSKNKDLVHLTKFAVELTEDMTAAAATQKIEQGHTYLGVILDSERKPTGYISTNDLRKYLMNY